MRIPDVKPLNWHSPEYLKLAETSHQTSLYILPEWLDMSKPIAYGAWFDNELVSAIFASPTLNHYPFVQYQGLLRSRREQPAIDRALLEALEGHPCASVFNPPSLVDVAPFDWRWQEAGKLWSADVRRTVFIDKGARPHPTLVGDTLPVRCACDPKDFSDIAWGEAGWDALMQISTFKSVACWRAGGVAWVGTDLQGRGYLIVAAGKQWEQLVWALSQGFQSFDLGGANSKEMRRRARPFGGILRTSYAMRYVTPTT